MGHIIYLHARVLSAPFSVCFNFGKITFTRVEDDTLTVDSDIRHNITKSDRGDFCDGIKGSYIIDNISSSVFY